MKMLTILKPDFELKNQKGSFTQLVHGGWNQINVLESLKGNNRGGHYHIENHEAFYVISGSITLTLENGCERESAQFRQGDFFVIKPGVKHDFYFNEDTIMVSMYDKGVEHEDGSMDIHNAQE